MPSACSPLGSLPDGEAGENGGWVNSQRNSQSTARRAYLPCRGCGGTGAEVVVTLTATLFTMPHGNRLDVSTINR